MTLLKYSRPVEAGTSRLLCIVLCNLLCKPVSCDNQDATITLKGEKYVCVYISFQKTIEHEKKKKEQFSMNPRVIDEFLRVSRRVNFPVKKSKILGVEHLGVVHHAV